MAVPAALREGRGGTGGVHLGSGEVPNAGLTPRPYRHPGAGAVLLQSAHAGLLLPGQGTEPLANAVLLMNMLTKIDCLSAYGLCVLYI